MVNSDVRLHGFELCLYSVYGWCEDEVVSVEVVRTVLGTWYALHFVSSFYA